MEKTTKFKRLIFGLLLLILGMVLTFVWFGWKLMLILFILFWSNNIDESTKRKESAFEIKKLIDLIKGNK